MIVRGQEHALWLITQPDHAALAADVMEAWRADGFPERASRTEVLFATREHDNGWVEPDRAPMVNPATGRPYDFVNAPDAIKQALWPRALQRLAPAHPLAAALVAQHALTVYRRYRSDGAWRPFFDVMSSERERLLRHCGITDDGSLERFARDYQIVHLGDLLSLVFCNGWTEPFRADAYRIQLCGTRLSVTPDPFGGASVSLCVGARCIADRSYAGDGDLARAVAAGPERWIAGQATGCEQP